MEEQKIITLLIAMIIDYDSYGDEIGFTKQELNDFIEKYDLYNLDYSPNNAIYLYNKKYLSKDDFIKKIRELFDDIESNRSDHMDIIEYVEFLEKNNLIDICIDKMSHNNIKKDEYGIWCFYAEDDWSYFSKYFSEKRDYRKDVVKMILSGEGLELFDYDCDHFDDFSYLNVNDKNLKYLKTIVQNMKDDFEIDQDEIDNIGDLKDIVSIAKEYDLEDLLNGLKMSYCRSQGYADEKEAYDSVINQILDHFGLTTEELSWVKRSEKSKHSDTLKIKFKSEGDAKDAIILLYKIENEPYDNSDYLISYYSPYNGWYGDAGEFIDDTIQDTLSDYVNEYLS